MDSCRHAESHIIIIYYWTVAHSHTKYYIIRETNARSLALIFNRFLRQCQKSDNIVLKMGKYGQWMHCFEYWVIYSMRWWLSREFTYSSSTRIWRSSMLEYAICKTDCPSESRLAFGSGTVIITSVERPAVKTWLTKKPIKHFSSGVHQNINFHRSCVCQWCSLNNSA